MSGEYPVLNNYCYLNTASSGLISRSLYQQRRLWDEDFLNRASLYRDPIYQQIEEVRDTVRDFLGAEGMSLGLVPNLSYGMNILLEGASFNKEVLTIQDDYPSFVWPFRSRDMTTTSEFPLADWSLSALLDHIERHRPTAFAFSAVQYLTGRVINAQWIRSIRASFPNLLLMMDGTQFIGTRPFSAQEMGIDLLIGSGYKWINAGFGNGYMAVSARLAERLNPRTAGYNSVKKHEWMEEIALSGRLEPGHQPTSSFLSLQYAIKELLAVGLDNIHQHIHGLYMRSMERMIALKHPAPISEMSSIVTLSGKEEEVKRLGERNVICSYRDGIRFSFHHYNTKSDIDRFFDELSAIRKK